MAALPEPAQPTVISRAEAIASGAAKYFTGKPCKRGHVAERAVTHKHCLECCRQVSAVYYSGHKEIHMKRTNRWRENHPIATKSIYEKWRSKNIERERARAMARRAKNPALVRAEYKKWAAANPAAVKANSHARRARLLGAEGRHTASDIAAIMGAQRGRCANCRTSVKVRRHVDHIIPLARGGSNWPRNLQILCPSCNLRKRAADPIDFARREGKLV